MQHSSVNLTKDIHRDKIAFYPLHSPVAYALKDQISSFCCSRQKKIDPTFENQKAR